MEIQVVLRKTKNYNLVKTSNNNYFVECGTDKAPIIKSKFEALLNSNDEFIEFMCEKLINNYKHKDMLKKLGFEFAE
jgi:hypothetical protein